MEAEYILIPLIGLAGFYLKGVIGAGPTTVIVSLSSLIIDPKSTVVLASFVNIFGGLVMLRIDRVALKKRFWVPIAAVMILGSVVGAALLKRVPSNPFQIVLGITFILTGLWFILKTPKPLELYPGAPEKAGFLDLSVGTFSGICGGFIGINVPPLVLYFGSILNKRNLRRFLVLIYFPAAIAQSAAFLANGMLTGRIVFLGSLILPMMFLGIWLGNHTFKKVSETWFRRMLGILLMVLSVRLILRGLG